MIIITPFYVNAATQVAPISIDAGVTGGMVIFTINPSNLTQTVNVSDNGTDDVDVVVDMTLGVNQVGAWITYEYWNITFYKINTTNQVDYNPTGYLFVSGTPGSDYDRVNYLYYDVYPGSIITIGIFATVQCFAWFWVPITSGACWVNVTINCE
jgi:hypothetical protein